MVGARGWCSWWIGGFSGGDWELEVRSWEWGIFTWRGIVYVNPCMFWGKFSRDEEERSWAGRGCDIIVWTVEFRERYYGVLTCSDK